MSRTARYPNATPNSTDLIGYDVESVGGRTGTVDPATRDAQDRYLVIRVGRWPTRRRVVVPAGAVNCVDSRRRRLWVERDRDQVVASAQFDPVRHSRGGQSGRGVH